MRVYTVIHKQSNIDGWNVWRHKLRTFKSEEKAEEFMAKLKSDPWNEYYIETDTVDMS